MSYAVKEIFYTLQGEGGQAGRPAVFCRFALCNLWTGRERDRHRATCQFCDTDFLGTDGPGGGRVRRGGGGRRARARPLVVCTGGEPALQLDGPAVAALHAEGFEVAIETNGTRPLPPGLDWVCVSPKGGAELVVQAGDELKLVYPQAGPPPERFELPGFRRLLLQPMDGPDRAASTRAAIDYCLAHPQWQLSVQSHKYLGIP